MHLIWESELSHKDTKARRRNIEEKNPEAKTQNAGRKLVVILNSDP
jgi:hypothetical protein